MKHHVNRPSIVASVSLRAQVKEPKNGQLVWEDAKDYLSTNLKDAEKQMCASAFDAAVELSP